MSQVKYSRQREVILNFLTGRTDHPSAEAIYQGIHKDFPQVSLGTVYRNLSLLTSLGLIAAISPGDGREHYDWNTAPHSHFLCNVCGAVKDVDYAASGALLKAAGKDFDGRIEKAELIFSGICGDCLAKEEATQRNLL